MDFHAPVARSLFQEMVSYAGWSAFGSVAMMGKNQGIAIILNLFKGTAINAAYGVAHQINGLLSSFTSSIQKAIAPQLMQKEGANQRDASVAMSFSLVKVATLVFGLMAIPAIIEMRSLLALWLGDNIPEYTVPFCRLILLCQLLFQFSSGVALSIDAGGKIKAYRLALSCVLILNLPVAYMLMREGFQPYAVLFSTVVIEMCCLGVRIYFARTLVGYPVVAYFMKCFFPMSTTLLVAFWLAYPLHYFMTASLWRMLGVGIATSLSILFGTYTFALSHVERGLIRNITFGIMCRLRK
jgi:O-antigen/teichoic acid export membrane protein